MLHYAKVLISLMETFGIYQCYINDSLKCYINDINGNLTLMETTFNI